MILEMKNTSEIMVDLAYSALIFQDPGIAEEVLKLEEHMDELYTKFELKVLEILQKKSEEVEEEEVLGLLRLGVAAENIADAASRMAELVIGGVKAHPVLRYAIEETEETIMKIEVDERSPFAGVTVEDAEFDEKAGISIIAIRRGNKWFINPQANLKIEPGDVLITRGFKESKDVLESFIREKRSSRSS